MPAIVNQRLMSLLQEFLPQVEYLERQDIMMLEAIRQLVFAEEYGYLTNMVESIDVTAQAMQGAMEQHYEQLNVPETEEE